MLHMTTAWKDKEAQPWYSWKVLTQKSKTNFSQKLKNYPQDMSYVTQVSSSWIEWRLFLLKMTNDLSQSQNLSGYQNSMETFYTLVKKKLKEHFESTLDFNLISISSNDEELKRIHRYPPHPVRQVPSWEEKKKKWDREKELMVHCRTCLFDGNESKPRGLNSNIPQKLQLKNWRERLVHFAEMSLQ